MLDTTTTTTTTTTIPSELIDELPVYASVDDCTITTYGDLIESHDVEATGDHIPESSTVLVVPGWIADDGGAEAEYPHAESAADAARDYVDDGAWGEELTETTWVRVYTWRIGYVLIEDEDGYEGEVLELEIDRETHTVAIEPYEPPCTDGHDHDWQAPIEVVGGVEENPGVYGHGGGVRCTEVCAHCGMYRVTDSWAQDPETGEQGLESIEYRDADDRSMRWVEGDDE